MYYIYLQCFVFCIFVKDFSEKKGDGNEYHNGAGSNSKQLSNDLDDNDDDDDDDKKRVNNSFRSPHPFIFEYSAADYKC